METSEIRPIEYYQPPVEANSQQLQTDGIGLRHSPSIGALIAALAKARAEFKPVKKENENPFFKSKYADLATLIEATCASLSKNGLCVVQSPRTTERGAVITTVLAHSSGEWISDDLSLPATKQDAQGMGSVITYARRYAYQSMLNIAAEEDDDGNAASATHSEYGSSIDRSPKSGLYINAVQQNAILSAIKQGKKTDDEVTEFLKTLGVSKFPYIKKTDVDKVVKWALKISDDLQVAIRDSVAIANNMKKLHALAKEHRVTHDDLHKYAVEMYHVQSLADCTPDQLAEVEEWISSIEA